MATKSKSLGSDSYALMLRLTHNEVEKIKHAVALRCLAGAWAPDSDAGDWLMWVVMRTLLEEQAFRARTPSLSNPFPTCPQCRSWILEEHAP